PSIKKIQVAEDVPISSIQRPVSGLQSKGTPSEQPALPDPGPRKISALDKIRKQYKSNGASSNGNTNQPLDDESLTKAWKNYVLKLKEAKNPAAQPFDLAVLRIKDENCFEVVTSNNIEQKFIEQERNKLFHFLQDSLQNRVLQFNVTVEERPQDRPPIEISLTAKEQFQKMIEQYPLVKELKDRLRLDLDY
ncbi:MAG TPA: hypothetical protein VF476_07710, partial [Chitinophagaceae bacterium]